MIRQALIATLIVTGLLAGAATANTGCYSMNDADGASDHLVILSESQDITVSIMAPQIHPGTGAVGRMPSPQEMAAMAAGIRSGITVQGVNISDILADAG